jgi:hypothetical protein
MLLADRVAIITGGACVFLSSDLAKYFTGVTLDVNAGMRVH